LIWKSKCTPKIKSFFWLLANDRLITKDMLIRKNFILNGSGLCRFCDNGSFETRDHLFGPVISVDNAGNQLISLLMTVLNSLRWSPLQYATLEDLFSSKHLPQHAGIFGKKECSRFFIM
jgi:hypothetical protein